MNQLTEEQRKRVKQIRERQQARRVDAGRLRDEWCIGEEVLTDIDFLLSLIDSQAAAGGLVRAAAIYREGLDRIWRLLDLTLERTPGDVAALQKTAHEYLVRGNTVDADAIMAKARQLAVDISGEHESANEVRTLTQAWQIIGGALRDGKLA